VGTPTAGGNLVATDLLSGSFIDMLRNAMVIDRMGVRMMTGLVGQIAIPKQTGSATAYWVAESGAPTESQQTIGQVTMSPKTVGAYTDFSRKLTLQSSISVEQMVNQDLATVLGLAIQQAAINGTGADNQPSGLLTLVTPSVIGGTDGLNSTRHMLHALNKRSERASAADSRAHASGLNVPAEHALTWDRGSVLGITLVEPVPPRLLCGLLARLRHCRQERRDLILAARWNVGIRHVTSPRPSSLPQRR
jgi:hypothetical protein